MGKEKNHEYFAHLLILIGGLITIVAGALAMYYSFSPLNGMGIVSGLIVLILGLIALMTVIKVKKLCNAILIIPIGIIIIILTWFGILGFLAGLIIVIGGIFLIVDF